MWPGVAFRAERSKIPALPEGIPLRKNKKERFLVASLLGMTSIRPRPGAAEKLGVSYKTLLNKIRAMGMES